MKIFVFVISQNSKQLSKYCVSQNFDNAVSQPPYVGVEKGGRAAGTALAHPPG